MGLGFRSIEFLVQEAFVGVRRNGLMAVASISTIALSLAILASFCLLIMGAHVFAQRELGKFEIAVFLNRDIDKDALTATAEAVRKMPSVKSVIVYTKEEAWPEFKKTQPGLSVAGLKNPLSDKLRVDVRNPADTTRTADDIRSLPNVHKVDDGRTQQKYVFAIANFVKWFGAAAAVALLAATVLIISNAIRLTVFARRREIRVMQLVGATNWFIRIPLVVEGVVFGAVGAAVAFGLVVAGTSYMSSAVCRVLPFMLPVSTGVDRMQILLLLVCGGAIIGAAGSLVSIRRFLNN